MHVPVHLGRVLFGDIHANLRIGFIIRCGRGKTGGLERVFRRLIETVHGEVAALRERRHRLADLCELGQVDIREHRADRLGCDLGEILVLHADRILLVHGVEQEFSGIVAGEHTAIRQGDLPVDRDHLLQEHRVDHDDTVKMLIRTPRGTLPDHTHAFRRTLRVRIHRQISHVE